MSDEMAKVQRFSRTEKAIRAMDATDIVEMVHAMEDERDALRAALDAAEKDSDAWRKSNWALLTERDAALAARDAAWRAGRDAAERAIVGKLPSNTHAFCLFTVAEAAKKIRALQPPADLAAEAPGDEVAKEREAWQPLYEAAQNLAASLDGGFVACSHCGEQEATGDMDFVPEFLAAIRARAGA